MSVAAGGTQQCAALGAWRPGTAYAVQWMQVFAILLHGHSTARLRAELESRLRVAQVGFGWEDEGTTMVAPGRSRREEEEGTHPRPGCVHGVRRACGLGDRAATTPEAGRHR